MGVDKLKKAFDDEKHNGLEELEKFRTALSGRETKNNEMWTQRLKQMNSDMLALKTQCAQQALQFKAAIQKAEEEHSSKLADVTSQHKSEMERVVKQHQEEINAKVQELDEAKGSFDVQLADKSRRLTEEEQKCESLEAQLRDAKLQLEASLSDSGTALQEANAARA